MKQSIREMSQAEILNKGLHRVQFLRRDDTDDINLFPKRVVAKGSFKLYSNGISSSHFLSHNKVQIEFGLL